VSGVGEGLGSGVGSEVGLAVGVAVKLFGCTSNNFPGSSISANCKEFL